MICYVRWPTWDIFLYSTRVSQIILEIDLKYNPRNIVFSETTLIDFKIEEPNKELLGVGTVWFGVIWVKPKLIFLFVV